ncbi:MAG: hypothetical protein EOO69_03240 [Moraxellaceae bacterium]|nr:MAG: hypothetical protein EOO69_03240 [Moraxellaceae bacterium]
MKSTLTFKTLMMIGLSVVSIHSFAYTNHDSRDHHAEHSRDYHAVDYRPVKVIQVSHESHRDLHNENRNDNSNFNPHTNWKTGYVLPNQYRAKTYEVVRYNSYGLQRPGKNQRWFKIKGDYVLVNVANHHIVRIINGR